MRDRLYPGVRRRRHGWLLIGLCLVFTTWPGSVAQAKKASVGAETDRDDVALETTIRFETVAIHLETGDDRLALYQIEIRVARGSARIVGIEGGSAPEFAEPPYYDPAALEARRIILAAFHIGRNHPHGRIHVATLHMAVEGPETPAFEAELEAVAGPGGTSIEATVDLERGGPQ